MSVQTITNVRLDQVGRYTTMFIGAGAASVTGAPENDGEVTLIVVWPDRETRDAGLLPAAPG